MKNFHTMHQQTYSASRRSLAFILLLVLAVSASPTLGQWEDGGQPRGAFQPFAKTVGTNPGVCSVESDIEVTAGTTVYYCYELFDPPPFTYAYNITDDILGFIAAGNASANETITAFASVDIFADVTNVGIFGVFDTGNGTGSRGPGVFFFNDTATVSIMNGSGGGAQFDAAIPTLSEFSMFAFGALLLLGAAIMLRRGAN